MVPMPHPHRVVGAFLAAVVVANRAAGDSPAAPTAAAAAARRALQGVPSTAAPAITVTGVVCHPSADGHYALMAEPLNERAHYVSDDGWHVYWTPIHDGLWVLDTDTDAEQAQVDAYLFSSPGAPFAPPTGPGSGGWSEWCAHDWGDTALMLTEELSAANCAARAQVALGLPACRGVKSRVLAASVCGKSADDDMPCTVAC
eukprot:COSAG04_NODE_11290_length_718_cov_1.222940_1_plen_200_part_10